MWSLPFLAIHWQHAYKPLPGSLHSLSKHPEQGLLERWTLMYKILAESCVYLQSVEGAHSPLYCQYFFQARKKQESWLCDRHSNGIKNKDWKETEKQTMWHYHEPKVVIWFTEWNHLSKKKIQREDFSIRKLSLLETATGNIAQKMAYRTWDTAS